MAHRELTVKAGGVAVSRRQHLLAVNVTNAANRIAAARIVYQDGAAATSDFALSSADTFVPGTEIEILGGPADDPETLFRGVVIKQLLKVRDHTAPQLIIECRHKAVRMTAVKKNRYFFDMSDDDVMLTLITDAGGSADIAGTDVTHEQLLQYDSTDWDFLLARAAANGQLVFTTADGVTVKRAAHGAEPSTTLQFGATILELDAELDARAQYRSVKGITWDPSQQEVVEREATDPQVAGAGNLSTDDLAAVMDVSHLPLTHAALGTDEAQAWADAEWLRTQVARTSGRIKCEGVGTVRPGDVVALTGVGERFSGNVFVTGVRHDYDLVQGWKTHLQYGSVDDAAAASARAPQPAAGLVPGVSGLQIGVVVSNEDPSGAHRVRVRMPLMSADADGAWARVAAVDAGDDRGLFIRPEIGDEVILGFLHDDPRHPVILGMLHSSAHAAPLTGSDDNHEKLYQTRSKLKLYFNDDTKVLKLETPAGNAIALDEDAKAISIQDQHGNRIEMTSSGILIESATALELKAATAVKIESSTSLDMKSGSTLKLEGAAGAELSSSAITKVRGSLLQLN